MISAPLYVLFLRLLKAMLAYDSSPATGELVFWSLSLLFLTIPNNYFTYKLETITQLKEMDSLPLHLMYWSYWIVFQPIVISSIYRRNHVTQAPNTDKHRRLWRTFCTSTARPGTQLNNSLNDINHQEYVGPGLACLCSHYSLAACLHVVFIYIYISNTIPKLSIGWSTVFLIFGH